MQGEHKYRKTRPERKKPAKKIQGVKSYRKNLSEEEKFENRRARIKTEDKGERPRKDSEQRTHSFKPRSARTFERRNLVTDKRSPGNKSARFAYDKPAEIRLNRYVANSGVCSRREADKYISMGLITVNGKVITELGSKVTARDVVKFDGRRLTAEQKVYILLNKPRDFVTTTEDPHSDKTVMDLIKNACTERVYPVGRLDKTTTGLLLFTNDGDLSKRLTHPSHNVKKIYQVTLDKPVIKNDLRQIAEGIKLEDGIIAADAVSYIDAGKKDELGIEIHSGKNRIVRRIFEHLGYKVKKLDRVYFAGLTKKNLPRGKWRFLSRQEISFLKMS